jgi:paraquat-inducible protein B
MIGAFVVGAVLLAVVAVGVLGSGRFFRQRYPAILFFKGDVNGLKVGAPVKFKGIPVGGVKSVMLSLGEVIGTRDPGKPFLVPVIIEFDGDTIVKRGIMGTLDSTVLEKLVERGMRGQLKLESIVTGVLYVDLGMYPGTAYELQGDYKLSYPEIPTIPNALEEVQAKAGEFLSKLNESDIKGLVGQLKDAVKDIDDVVKSPDVQKTLAELPKTIAAIDGAADQLQRTFAKVEGLSPNADAALVAARDTLRSAGGVVAADSPLLYRLDRTLDDLSAAAEAIRHFAEDLERNPGILVRGRAASKEEGR